MTRLGLCVVVLAQLSALVPLHAQDSDVVPGSGETQQIPGPACHFITDWNTSRAKLCTAAETAAWLADIQHWRGENHLRMGYDANQYQRPELLWTQTSFIQPQMMVHDRYFYDPAAQTTPSAVIWTTSTPVMAASIACSSGTPIPTSASTIATSSTSFAIFLVGFQHCAR
jgi:hypothetical protein